MKKQKIGRRGAMNVNLVDYGIADEQSDIRAHVTIPGRQIVVFKTADMQTLITQKKYPERKATQPGVKGLVTGVGVVVPIIDIESYCILKSSIFPWDKYNYKAMSIVECGNAAVTVVKAAIRANRFPLWVCGIVTTDKEIDIQGTDIIVKATRRIQTKHDWGAYSREDGGTGNVFIQTKECNPLKLYGDEQPS